MGNPVLNPATIIFAAFVLSWQWALVRLGAGLLLIVLVGYIGTRFGRQQASQETAAAMTGPSIDAVDPTPRSAYQMLSDWVKMVGRLSLAIVPEWIVIVLLLGAARAWLFPLAGPSLSFGIVTLVGLAIAGTLFVIPTAGEVPIVQSLLSYGVAPGLAGALLITLPALSLPSMVMTRQAFPTKLLVMAAGLVAVIGIATGVLAQLAL